MLKRRLQALGYLEWDKVNPNNPQHFRKVVVWLEDQKIRKYRIEDRAQLRDTGNANWPNVFAKYCNDLQCPAKEKEINQLEWLLEHAIWLELGDDYQAYQKVLEKKAKNKIDALKPSLKSVNPLDNLEFNSNEFINGVTNLAKLLRVPRHPDHLLTLAACSKLVKSKLNPQVLKEPKNKPQGKPFPIMDMHYGFKYNDKALENAAKGLALLYIHDLRDLQTRINEAIVRVQSVTANPKTDTKLGKVGK